MSDKKQPGSRSSKLGYAWLLVIGICLYFMPFFAVLVDERILHTFFFSTYFPDEAEEVFRVIYPFWSLFM